MPLEKRPDAQPIHGHEPPDRGDRRHHASEDFFGLDVESMSPRSQLATALAIIVPVALSGVFLFTFTSVWWIWFTFFWVAFPAFGLLVRGVAGLTEARTRPPAGNSKERELLSALRKRGELTPAEAAIETSLSVAEADRMLKELTEGGYLEVRVRGGGLFYSMWEAEDGEKTRELEDR